MVRYVLALGDKDLIQGTWKPVGMLDLVKWRVGRAWTEASDLAFVQGVRWGKLWPAGLEGDGFKGAACSPVASGEHAG